MKGMCDNRAGFYRCPDATLLTDESVRETYVDVGGMEEFWLKWYLRGFVDRGAGKIKFVQARVGAGKTHLLRHFVSTASDEGYATVFVDATAQRMGAIDELYRAVAVQAPWEKILDGCATSIVHNDLGYNDFNGEPADFRRWAETTRGRSGPSLTADLRDATDKWVRAMDIHSNWREPLRTWVLRHITGEATDVAMIRNWFCGERMSVRERKTFGAGTKLDRRNGRAWLLSLVTLLRATGYKGLVLALDNADVWARSTRVEGIPYYTRSARDYTYEMLRELIDESHHAPHLFALIAGDVNLFENQKTGVPSYPALWQRIGSEIALAQVNRFADLLDLDALWRSDGRGGAQVASRWTELCDGIGLRENHFVHEDVFSHVEGAAREDSLGLDWGLARRTVHHVLTGSQMGGNEHA
ncbi:hypothetical protein D2Q93_08825 [Alicyclobacillaceae bacterium I2511]|nr:hypothetical protein D2Q93_08825 [Alicyclobacillaceae bacterium I2511]